MLWKFDFLITIYKLKHLIDNNQSVTLYRTISVRVKVQVIYEGKKWK